MPTMLASGAATRELLYLEDLYVGRRFTSGEHPIDERQIKTFASAQNVRIRVRSAAFHLDDGMCTIYPNVINEDLPAFILS